jgi:hypothetical protein
MPNKMLSLKVSLVPFPNRHRQRQLRLVMELLEQEAIRHSQPPIEAQSQSLLADVATQPPSNNQFTNTGGQR